MKALSAVILALSLLFIPGCASQNANNTQPPPPAQYTISGTLADLATGSGGVVLEDNGGDNLPLTANGGFQFVTKIASGGAYNVTVGTQPSSPTQQCTVANGSGMATADVSNIKVECGHNEWAWMAGSKSGNQVGTYGTLGSPAPANSPGGRQYPATWTDSSGSLWLFGGYGYDSNETLMPMSDLWEFSGGEWTWRGGPTLSGQSGNYGTVGVAGSNNIPGARFQPASWTDASGTFWMFGGNGFDSVGNESPMNDVWKYSGGEWTWVGGSSVGRQNGHYGTLGVADPSNLPGGRFSSAVWKDSSGNIWVFGGTGYDGSNPINGPLNDLWKYSGGEWTWMGGSTTQAQRGVYGTQGTAAATNIPGSREGAYAWVDASGGFWLFGGYGYDANGSNGYLNDLWKYSGGEWTWIGGSNVVSQPGVYGTQGMAAANNIPGARWSGMAWTDSAGNAWLFGGSAYFTSTSAGFANDLWKYRGGEWTWVSGSNSPNQISSYGTEGTLSPGNAPGSRFFLNGWIDASGNLWLFGGYGQVSGTTGNLNDLWMYMP
ncbi:MAG TPA: hypothetical protein VMG31_15315 [Verrucomicrobiae bacterium]|nr:hypothetical protein [Verrucomicrobiae bacterium]